MNENEIRQIVTDVLAKITERDATCQDSVLPVEASARHVHLTTQAVELLFGKGTSLTKKRDLSQLGEFLSEQRVKLVTTKGEIANVAVLGPERKAVQTELSMTDCRLLGITAPINLSGDLSGAGDVYIIGECGSIYAESSVIVAQNHIHMTPEDAKNFSVCDGDSVSVRVDTARPITFENVIVRVKPSFKLAMHVDFDEANACFLGKDTKGRIVRR